MLVTLEVYRVRTTCTCQENKKLVSFPLRFAGKGESLD